MSEKEVKLNLNVDSRKGEASIKRTSGQIKALGTTASASGAAIGAGSKSAAGGMLMMRSASTKAANGIKNLGSAMGGSNGKGGLIGMLIQYKGVIAGIGFAAVIASGAKFEREMATVGGIMRATKDDMTTLTKAAKDMGAKSEHGANKAAQALKFMGMAGYSAKQAIKALPGILNLATASSLDLAAVSDIVTDSLTAMNMKVGELSRFNDVLTGVTTRSNTTILMMGESLKYVAPVASQMGYDIEQLSAMLGILANSGIKASDAGTDLRQAMIKNVKVAKIFGTEASDLIGTLKKAVDAGWGVTEVTEKYGLIAAKSVLVLMKQIKEYEELEEELRNVEGETKKLADAKLDTLVGDFNLFKAAVEGLGLKVYDNIVDPLRVSIVLMTGLTDGITYFIKKLDEVYNSPYIQLMLLTNPFVSGEKAMLGVNLLTERVKLENLLAIAIKKRTEAEKLGQTEVVAQFNYIIANFKNQIKNLDNIGAKSYKVTTDDPITKRIRLENLLAIAIKKRADAERFGQTKYVEQFDNAIIILQEQLAALPALDTIREYSVERNRLEKEYQEGVTNFTSTNLQNQINAIRKTAEELKKGYEDPSTKKMVEPSKEDKVMIEAAAISQINKLKGDAANAEAARIQEIADKRTAAAEKRVADHEKVLRYISTEEENKIRSIENERDELLKLEQTASKIRDINAAAAEKIAEAGMGYIRAEEKAMSAMEEGIRGWSDSFGGTLNDMLWGAETTWEGIRDSFYKMLTQMAIDAAMADIMGATFGKEGGDGGWISSALDLLRGLGGGTTTTPTTTSNTSTSAKGNVFSQGNKMLEYAKGGIVNSPTIFPMSNGAGLMGEAGPEAIMPLRRGANGKLGVESATSEKQERPNQTIIINAVDSQSFAQAIERNPGAIVSVVNEAFESRSGLLNTVRRTL